MSTYDISLDDTKNIISEPELDALWNNREIMYTILQKMKLFVTLM
jgi:hypothetical protein